MQLVGPDDAFALKVLTLKTLNPPRILPLMLYLLRFAGVHFVWRLLAVLGLSVSFPEGTLLWYGYLDSVCS